jgi:hypothetical protein
MGDLFQYGDAKEGVKIEREGTFNCKITAAKLIETSPHRVTLACFTDMETGDYIFARYTENETQGRFLRILAQCAGLTDSEIRGYDDPAVLIGRKVTIKVAERNGYWNIVETHRYVEKQPEPQPKPKLEAKTADDLPF